MPMVKFAKGPMEPLYLYTGVPSLLLRTYHAIMYSVHHYVLLLLLLLCYRQTGMYPAI